MRITFLLVRYIQFADKNGYFGLGTPSFTETQLWIQEAETADVQLLCRAVRRRWQRMCRANETVEEPTEGVRQTFLCVFNAMKHDRVWILYIWEDVKFQVTFGMLQLSSYKDFWNKQEKKTLPGMCMFFLLSMERGRQGRSTSWVRDPLEMYGDLRAIWETPQLPRCWVHCVWLSRGRWDNNWWDVIQGTQWSSVKFCSWVILCSAIKYRADGSCLLCKQLQGTPSISPLHSFHSNQ